MPTLTVERFDQTNDRHIYDVAFIKSFLRPEEMYELSAVGATPKDLMGMVALGAQMGEVYLLLWDDEPVFVWGVYSSIQGIYGLFGFGTKETKRAMPAITKWGMRTWLPDFLERTEARRIEVRVPVSSVHSINWLKRLGMVPECTLPRYSVVDEDFIQLALTVGQTPNVLRRPIQSTSAPACHSSAV